MTTMSELDAGVRCSSAACAEVERRQHESFKARNGQKGKRTLKDGDQQANGGADDAHLALGRARRVAAVVEADVLAVLERRQVGLVVAVERLVVAVQLVRSGVVFVIAVTALGHDAQVGEPEAGLGLLAAAAVRIERGRASWSRRRPAAGRAQDEVDELEDARSLALDEILAQDLDHAEDDLGQDELAQRAERRRRVVVGRPVERAEQADEKGAGRARSLGRRDERDKRVGRRLEVEHRQRLVRKVVRPARRRPGGGRGGRQVGLGRHPKGDGEILPTANPVPLPLVVVVVLLLPGAEQHLGRRGRARMRRLRPAAFPLPAAAAKDGAPEDFGDVGLGRRPRPRRAHVADVRAEDGVGRRQGGEVPVEREQERHDGRQQPVVDRRRGRRVEDERDDHAERVKLGRGRRRAVVVLVLCSGGGGGDGGQVALAHAVEVGLDKRPVQVDEDEGRVRPDEARERERDGPGKRRRRFGRLEQVEQARDDRPDVGVGHGRAACGRAGDEPGPRLGPAHAVRPRVVGVEVRRKHGLEQAAQAVGPHERARQQLADRDRRRRGPGEQRCQERHRLRRMVPAGAR